MSGWDLLTWVALAVLGPGAVLIFVLFLRDLRRHEVGRRGEAGGESETPSARAGVDSGASP